MPDESRVIELDALLGRLRWAEKYEDHPAPEFTKEELRALLCFFHFTGLEAGVRKFAWWKDGVEYVGTGAWTLEDALIVLEEGVKKEMGVFYIREGQ